MVLFPIITNKLMFVGDYKVAGDDKTWIGYLGTFWGAIIGGVISGTITLMGVKMTIQNQKNEEFIRIYPQMMLLGDEITAELGHFLDEMDRTKINDPSLASLVLDFQKKSEELLVKSSKVNGFIYENYKNIHNYFYHFVKYLKENSSLDEGIIIYKLDLKEVEIRKQRIRNDMKEHEKLVMEISNTFFYLTVVDRVPKKFKRMTQKHLKKAKKNLEK